MIGAAVATAMNNTPIRPTALGLSRCMPSGSVVVPTGGSMVSLTEDPFSVFGLVLLVLRDRRSLMVQVGGAVLVRRAHLYLA
ncbi:Uncharacterised protein [Mycobacteroides abscessus subsp. abscessus]|nr:Uncharacterised protein [Mycobacteroides abscessus subsp. abscessus]